MQEDNYFIRYALALMSLQKSYFLIKDYFVYLKANHEHLSIFF
jgi:hypothetical protein